ncbi:uncharacterized protein DFL_003048 [Arthrobotrys flagrans]|uniref:Uncharacterized protein n=1 Tax=Arthrobotrys flagrans TaxID=97331 RepID=A0A437ACR4_ARTFL|nr:hypothetical protein DFL_003048 [Arthrobotrys flagrans]
MSLPEIQPQRTDQWDNPILPADYHGFSRVMCNEYLCDMILDYMDHGPTLWSLLNISRSVRACLLTYHFHRYRRIVIMRIFMPSHWAMPHPTNWTLRDEKYRRRMIDNGRWPKNKKYFDRFTDFNFEEFVIGKVLRIPYWVAPTIDTSYIEKMTNLGLFLTTLILDGTAVTGRGLFPASDPDEGAKRQAKIRFENLFKAGWFDAKILTRFPPPVTLPPPESNIPIPGPFSGFIAAMNDGRTVQLGNPYGAVTGGKVRRKDYFHVVDGIRPRVPVALTTLIPGKYKTHLPGGEENFPERTSHLPTRPEYTHAPNDPPKDGHPDEIKKYRPRFESLAGPVSGPDCEDSHGERDKTFTAMGLSGKGLHTHSAAGAGLDGREECKYSEGEEIEDEPNEEGAEEEQRPRKTKLVKVKDPGRQILGELCEICVPFFTCGDCGDFYCPSCLVEPREDDRPNPWAREQFLKDHNVVMGKDEYSCFTCQACFEYQLAWAKNEQERVEIWKFMGVNILQREMKDVKAKESEYATEADIQRRTRESTWGSYSAPKKKKRRPKVEDQVSSVVELKNDADSSDHESDGSGETSDTSSGYSSSSTPPEKSGENHPVIKKIDALYLLLGILVSRSTSTPHGTAELMKAMHLARKNILARKLAEQSYKRKRENNKQGRKRVKNADDPALNDPILKDSQRNYILEINTHPRPAGQRAATPLRNVVDEVEVNKLKKNFEWDQIWRGLSLRSRRKTKMKGRGREIGKKIAQRGVDWRLQYLPDDWSGERGKRVRRDAELSSSSDEDNIVIVTKDEKKKRKSLTKPRLAMMKMKLRGNKGSDGKALKVATVILEEQKRDIKQLGKLWAAKEAERKQEEAEEEAKKLRGLKGLMKRRAEKKEKCSKPQKKKSRRQKVGSAEDDMAEPPVRARGRRVRFVEVSGQDPPGVARRTPTVLDGRGRKIYKEETKEGS